MRPVTPSTNPVATLRLLILSVVAGLPVPEEELPRIVSLAGGGWKPTQDVVFDAVAALRDSGCLADRAGRLTLSDGAAGEIARLIDTYRPGALGDADVIACSAVMALVPLGRQRLLRSLLNAHWQAEQDWWAAASRHCPCEVPTVRRRFERRLSEATLELAALEAVGP